MEYRFFRKIGDIPRYIERRRTYNNYKTINAEKKDVIDKVIWTDKQLSEYNTFWKKNYGYIPNVGFNKYFESINGIYNYQYVARPLYDCVIEPRMNPYYYSFVLSQKNLQNSLFRCIEGLKVPDTYASCSGGIYVIDNTILNFTDFVRKGGNIGECLIKPTLWTSSGNKVRVVNIRNGADAITNESFNSIVKSYGKDFVIQELIAPSKELKAISLKSLNTFRVTTFIFNGEIYCSPVAFRIGLGDAITDNECTGGYAIGVTNDGKLTKTAYNYESSADFLYLDRHPDTGIVFKDYYVADIEKVKWYAKKMHSLIPDLGICSWDLSVNDKDEVTFIELNTDYQGTDMNQVTTGEALFGELTGKVINQFYKSRKI